MKALLKPRFLIAFFTALAFTPSARAVVTNIVWYRLGENDPGAANGVAATGTAIDLIGFENLNQFGGPIYTNGVSAAASNNVGSSLAVQFNGTSQYLSNTVVSTATYNFGIEAWVKPDNTTGGVNRIIAYNGDTRSNGWGIVQNGSNYFAILGGVGTVGSATAVAGTWTHLAFVSSLATIENNSFYVNGVQSNALNFSSPIAPTGGFAIGAAPQAPTTQNFSGEIDEVRVFMFGETISFPSQGLFTTNDLLCNLQRVATAGASSFSSSNATLDGVAYLPGLPTSAWFQWGTTTNYGNITPAQILGALPGSTNFAQVISNLQFSTTYHFRAAVSNSLGVATGADQSFTTFGPLAQTLPASGVDVTTATLNGATPSGGSATSVWFQWGPTTNYGNLTPVQGAPGGDGGGGGGGGFSQAISNLLANTTYQFRVVASNSIGVAAGSNLSFTTLLPLTVATLPASEINNTSATLNATGNPGGVGAVGYFEYGTTTNYFSTTSSQSLGSGTNSTNFSQAITGLTGGLTYHFRADAARSTGVVLGNDQSFTAPVFPAVTTLPASDAPNYALNFDGVDDWVYMQPNPFSTGFNSVANTFTMEFWVNPTASRAVTIETNTGVYGTSNQRYAIFPESGENDYAGAGLSIGTNGISVFEHAFAYIPSPLVYNAPILGWTHVAVVYVNRRPSLYVNGVLVRTGLTSTQTTVQPSVDLGGWSVDYGYFQGQIDEFRVWSSAQSQAQIQSNMNRHLLGNEAGLIAYFRCDEGRGTSLADSALMDPNPNLIGTLTNGTSFVLSGRSEPLSGSNATLNAIVNPLGLAASGWFEWGTTTNYGNVTPGQALGSGSGNTNLFQVLPALTAGNYQFRAVASNSYGIVDGGNQSFTIPVFGLTGTILPGIYAGSAAWGDYDNDGRLDILLAGSVPLNAPVCDVWRNTSNGFSSTGFAFGGGSSDIYSVAWGDIDNDGRLDFLLESALTLPAQMLNRNTGSGFIPINNSGAPLPGVQASSVAWGDYDNDGQLDLLLEGYASPSGAGQVWRNSAARFYDVATALPGLQNVGGAAWGDYDNDGRLDILRTGTDTNGLAVTELWRNTGAGFVKVNAGLPGLGGGSVAWGDYDNDGHLDILLTGTTNGLASGAITQVWRNTGSGFTNINAGLQGVYSGSAVWGDYDNDGRLDILLCGMDASTNYITQVWRNTGSGFSNINAGLPGVTGGTLAWGDYDNDGRLDILLCGSLDTTGLDTTAQVWHNDTPITNTPPTAPTGLVATLSSHGVMFNWNAASDAQTPASGLTYNLRVGTTPGSGNLVGPMAAGSGVRLLPQMGNAQMCLSRTITNLPLGQPIYWSVQAIDTAFAGGPFAPEQSLTFNTVMTPPSGNPVPGDVNGDGIVSQSELAAVLANLNGNGTVSEAELDLVLSNYYVYSPFLLMTNVAGLGGTDVTFALSNSTAGSYSVEYSTDLANWQYLGPATPLYQFIDTNAPAIPLRYYRLRWP